MANYLEKWDDNPQGKYYVDHSCILCDVCFDIAPGHFKESADGQHYTLAKQPHTTAEESAVREAMHQCPVGAIGDDGILARV